MHEIQKTSTYSREYHKLALRYRRMVDEALDIIKESPVDYKSKITKISKHKDGLMYRYRLPGFYLMYVVPPFEEEESVVITMLDIKSLTKH